MHGQYLEHVVTDTHYDDPDRRGRQVAFLAHLATDQGHRFWGIAAEEYTAVCVDTAGIARVFGGYPQDQDFAYFLQITCEATNYFSATIHSTKFRGLSQKTLC